jgi:ABC-type branched-subunit amino acid transport system permease subunit
MMVPLHKALAQLLGLAGGILIQHLASLQAGAYTTANIVALTQRSLQFPPLTIPAMSCRPCRWKIPRIAKPFAENPHWY